MSDKITFNDCDVDVEIYDAVIAKWVLTDFLELDPTSTAYLRNRDKIQEKLTPGTNITIDENNVISANVRLDQVAQFISQQALNELKLGDDGLLYTNHVGLVRDGGALNSRDDLPTESLDFVFHLIKSDGTFLMALNTQNGLTWRQILTMDDLVKALGEYTSKTLADAISFHNTNEESHPSILAALEAIRQKMSDKEHFRGYVSTTADVLAINAPEDGDFVYNAETGTKWIYSDKDGWVDSEVPVPDQTVPPADSPPLMDGPVAKIGVEKKYALSDHIHQSDVSRVPTTRKINGYDLSVDRNISASDVGASPKVHSSTAASTYGGGTGTEFGHVALSDIIDGTSDATESIAATPKAVNDVKNSVLAQLSNVSEVRDVDEPFTLKASMIDTLSVKAIGQSQLYVTFTLSSDLTPDDTPLTVLSEAVSSILPLFPRRFGQVWDFAKVEQVGFCMFDQDGDLTINAVSTLFANTEYTLLV